MIERLYVDNFRCLVNFTLKLGAMNLLMGANGSGKSATLEVLRLISAFVSGGVESRDLFPTRTLTRWETRDIQTFEVDVKGNGGLYRYRFEIEHDRTRERCRLKNEKLLFDGRPLYVADGEKARLYRDDYSEGPEVICDWFRSGLGIIQKRDDNTKLTWFKSQLGRTLVARVNPSAMLTRSEEEKAHPSYDLSDFVSWLRHLSQEQQEQYYQLTTGLKEQVLEGFKSFKLVSDGQNAKTLRLIFGVETKTESGRNTFEIGFDELSDGQRVLVALHTLASFAFQDGATLCLDEPENYLALPEIQPWLLKLLDATQEGKCQAVLVSHHPELVNFFASSSGHWFERQGGGQVLVRPVTTTDKSGLSVSELVARGWLNG